jgi:hypothetical protein
MIFCLSCFMPTWSWKFFPTPGRSWITWMSNAASLAAGPVPERKRSFGVSIDPAVIITSWLQGAEQTFSLISKL